MMSRSWLFLDNRISVNMSAQFYIVVGFVIRSCEYLILDFVKFFTIVYRKWPTSQGPVATVV